MERASGHVWRFAGCELDESRRELRVGGTVVEIEAKPFAILQQLLVHAGEVVTKGELLDAVWPGVLVVDGSLATAVSKLRKALGRDEVLVTVPRIGYRLAVPVERTRSAPPAWRALHLAAGEPVPGRAQWRLVRRLDVSPSSEVWLAEHAKTHETRVFKFAPDDVRLRSLKREVTLARLLRESLGARARDFVRVLEWQFDSPPYFLESEYVGPNLAEWAEQEGGLDRVPLALRLRLLVDVALAVAAAHELGVLHKDLKPGNILVSTRPDGAPEIRIADFGSASLLEPSRLDALGITGLGFTHGEGDAGSLSGTVMYLAPEVLAGQSPTPASDVYALGLLCYQLVVGDFRKPIAAGWEADIPDALIREDIARAAAGDPARRFKTARELADRLSTLDARRTAAARETPAQTLHMRLRHPRARVRWVAVAAVVASLITGLSLYRATPSSVPGTRSVAVLPFDNAGSETDLDFLRLALPDEVATILSHAHALLIRPLAASLQRDGSAIDVQNVGRQMGVDSVVTGSFIRAGEQLHITLEAIDVTTNRVLWRDAIDAPARSLISAQVQIALRVQGRLVPALGGRTSDAAAEPRNEDAYALFLQSAAAPMEPAPPNAQAIEMLERAVVLDPSYPPAWVALARRYYVEARYGAGDAALMDRYDSAMARALALDPNYVGAATGVILRRVELGDLVTAHENAESLVQRRPDSVDAHFVLSYVLRYAGLLQDAGRHCETALLLDSRTQTSGLRSCAIVFLLRGDYPRTANYLRLDHGSDWAKAFSIHMLVRQGKTQEASQLGSPHMPQWRSYDMLLACAEHRPANEIATLARNVRPSDDPETNYFSAAHLAYCGQTDAAFEMLARAVKGNYCSYPEIESDPFFESLRALPRFREMLTMAKACQSDFLSRRAPARRAALR